MSPFRALLVAQLQQTWNRTRRESGLVGVAAGLAVGFLSAFALLGPALGAGLISFRLGREIGNPASAGVAVAWLTGLHATFALGFGLLGGLQNRLAFSRDTFRLYPVPPLQLLLAELPAGLLEVFPLVSATWLTACGAGLAAAQPGATSLSALLAAQGILWAALFTHLAGSVKRLAFKRPALLLPGLLLVGAFAVAAAACAWQGFAGLAEYVAVEAWHGLARQLPAPAFSAFLLVVVARVHAWEGRTEGVPRATGRAPRPFVFARPSRGVARLLVLEVLGTKLGRILVAMPLFLSGAVVLLVFVQQDVAAGGGKPVLPGIAALPWFGLFFPAVVLLDRELWMNQFGPDRHGVKTLLLVPVPTEEILVGKLQGLLAVALLQAALGVVPLFAIRAPGPAELLWGIAAGGTTFLFSAGAGHVLSARFPRAVLPDGQARPLPTGLTLIPLGMFAATISVLSATHSVSGRLGPWGPPLGHALVLAASVAGYRALLPHLARAVVACRERLVEELS